ncbi:chemotaxis protein CheX [Halobacillus litoralis]|uniref:chemotaxis protein CheX n=1 Tax=Halobacillus litoralis TaxID=45668 RepID=UPI001CD79A7E|nr:chemotaxis protein CheX [Halobacillus litoralis]MCA0970395.1 chemotaxis protein CheX [Halobacillus litoralis]
MSNSQSITDILNGSLDSVHSVFPFELSIEHPRKFEEPIQQNELGVLIGMTGDFTGRLLIDGSHNSFGYVGEKMFGMPLEGEMLYSFTGELANMIAGNLSTKVSERSISIDITPPTVIQGESRIRGFDLAFQVPVNLEDEHSLKLILMIDQKSM